MNNKLGFVHDHEDADRRFRAILRVRRIAREAIEENARALSVVALTEAEFSGLNDDETVTLIRDTSDNSDLLMVQDESLFLMAHACMEFTLVQLSDHLISIENNTYRTARGDRTFLENVALKIGTIGKISTFFESAEWKKVLLLAGVRNSMTHALSYQDREFSHEELDSLSEFGFGTACQVMPTVSGPPIVKPPIFFMKDECLSNSICLYRSVLSNIVTKLEAKTC